MTKPLMFLHISSWEVWSITPAVVLIGCHSRLWSTRHIDPSSIDEIHQCWRTRFVIYKKSHIIGQLLKNMLQQPIQAKGLQPSRKLYHFGKCTHMLPGCSKIPRSKLERCMWVKLHIHVNTILKACSLTSSRARDIIVATIGSLAEQSCAPIASLIAFIHRILYCVAKAAYSAQWEISPRWLHENCRA